MLLRCWNAQRCGDIHPAASSSTNSHISAFIRLNNNMAPHPETDKKMTLQDNPDPPGINTKCNKALSARGSICLRYDLLDFFVPTDKRFELLTDGLTDLTDSSWHILKTVHLHLCSLKYGAKLICNVK